jgi:hypothetical protein
MHTDMNKVVEIAKKESLFIGDVRFETDRMIIELIDGEELSAPLAWFPKLYYATPLQLAKWRIVGKGMNIRWPELDENISVESLLR